MDQANQLSEAEIKAKIRGFIKDNFLLGNDAKLQDTDSLMEKGIVDSTGILEVVTFVEENFGFKVADEELLPENLDSLNQLTAYIQKKTVGGA
ncbi:MAG TPA: acyl carrier protein [Candidatus Omnitrophota bacterium]|nr:acyl carrier protein [Candidatus Omnitrophota bacterium]